MIKIYLKIVVSGTYQTLVNNKNDKFWLCGKHYFCTKNAICRIKGMSVKGNITCNKKRAVDTGHQKLKVTYSLYKFK